MTEIFWAIDIKNSVKTKNFMTVLNSEVVSWLSKNLRKRPSDMDRRHDYIRRSDFGIKRNIGVKIYSEEDAMAFKLRWL